MSTKIDWLFCALGAALLLWCSTGHAEVMPDRVSRGGIVASEVHPAPAVGVEKKELPNGASRVGCGRDCVPDFGGGL